MMIDSKTFAEELTQCLDSTAKNLIIDGKKLKLILHVGTPKTGTTSLQTYLDKKQRKLRKKGILYPSRNHNADAPKHQWFEKNLVRTHAKNFLDNFKEILSHVDDDTHTILLSSEGIYNSWWDFTEESKSLLSVLNEVFEVKLWVWFREPLAFAESFYKQCMRNPVVSSIPCYGKDLSFAEVLAEPWFRQRLDYMGFINECERLFGDSSLSIFEYPSQDYQQDTVKTVSELLGLSTPHDNPTPRKNESMQTISAELYRVINRLELSAKEKEKIVPHLHQLNDVLAPYSNRNKSPLINEKSAKEIAEMTKDDMAEIRKRFIQH